MDNSAFNGIYRDLAEILGHEATLTLHKNFAGQYISLPKKLLSDTYLHSRILKEYDGKNAKALAKRYGYTYSWIMKLVKKGKSKEL